MCIFQTVHVNVEETVVKQEDITEEELKDQDPLEVQSDFIKNKKRKTIEITDIFACTFCGVEFSEMDFKKHQHFNSCNSTNRLLNNIDAVLWKDEITEVDPLSILKQKTLANEGTPVKKEGIEDGNMQIIEEYEEDYCNLESKIEIHDDFNVSLKSEGFL